MATIGEVQVIGARVNMTGSGTGTAYTVPSGNYAIVTLTASFTATGGSPVNGTFFVNINGVPSSLISSSSGGVVSFQPGSTYGGSLVATLGDGASVSFSQSNSFSLSWSVSGVEFLSANYP